MSEKKENRTRTIAVRLKTDEFDRIESKWKQSTCRKLSEYLRKIIFDRAVVTVHRNQSADDTLQELARLRTELNHIGNNFNQMVKRLHTISGGSELKQWMTMYELEKKTLSNKIEEIKNQSKKLVEKWLQ